MNQSDSFKDKNSKRLLNLYKEGKKTPDYTSVKRIKFRNLNGTTFMVHGTLEYETCKALDILKKNEDIYDWEYTNDRIPYLKLGKKIATYFMDFKVWITKDFFFYLETKGYPILNDLYKWNKVVSFTPMKLLLDRQGRKKMIEDPKYILKMDYLNRDSIEGLIKTSKLIQKEFKTHLEEREEIPF
jgi:hypothetical protein